MWVIFGSKGETTVLILEPPTLSLCHPAGKRQGNNTLMTADTEADQTLLFKVSLKH